MFGLLGFPGAARVGEAKAKIAMRKTAILTIRKHSDMVVSFGAGARTTLARFIGGGFERIDP
jgi:hypothetical protein